MAGGAAVFEMKSPKEKAPKPASFCSKKEFKALVVMVVFFLAIVAYMAWQEAERVLRWAEKKSSVPAVLSEEPGGAAAPTAFAGAEPARPTGAPAAAPGEGGLREPTGQEIKPPAGRSEEGEAGEAGEGGEGGEAAEGRKNWMDEWLKGQKADFRPLDPEFERVDEIDLEIIGELIDDYNLPEATSKIKDESSVFFHVYSFLRTKTPEELRAMTRKDVTYNELLDNPEPHRGTVIRLKAAFIKTYQRQRWTTPEAPKNVAGLNDTWIVFARDLKQRGADYAIVVSQSVRKQFRSDELVTCEGIFIKRWCGVTPDGRYRWLPMVATLELRKLKAPETGTSPMKYLVVAIFVVGGTIIFIAAWREFGKTAAARDHFRERQKVTRGLIAEQVKKNREEDLEGEKEAQGESETEVDVSETESDDAGDGSSGEDEAADSGSEGEGEGEEKKD